MSCVCLCVHIHAHVCVEPEGRKQAADPVPRCCFAQKSWRAASRLAQVTRPQIYPFTGLNLSQSCVTTQNLTPNRTYEEVCNVGLFLFNDILVLTRRTVRHRPFTLAHHSTHTFLDSVPVISLAVREITHSRCEFER